MSDSVRKQLDDLLRESAKEGVLRGERPLERERLLDGSKPATQYISPGGPYGKKEVGRRILLPGDHIFNHIINVNGNLELQAGAHLIPGPEGGLNVEGKLIFLGTEDNPVIVEPAMGYCQGIVVREGVVHFEHAQIIGMSKLDIVKGVTRILGKTGLKMIGSYGSLKDTEFTESAYISMDGEGSTVRLMRVNAHNNGGFVGCPILQFFRGSLFAEELGMYNNRSEYSGLSIAMMKAEIVRAHLRSQRTTALRVYSSQLLMEDSIIAENSARYGAGLSIEENSLVELLDTIVRSNDAKVAAAGTYLQESILRLKGTTRYEKNRAPIAEAIGFVGKPPKLEDSVHIDGEILAIERITGRS